EQRQLAERVSGPAHGQGRGVTDRRRDPHREPAFADQVERIGGIAGGEDDFVARESPAPRDREPRTKGGVGALGKQLPLHLCDEFDTSSVTRVNDTAPVASYRDGMATAKEVIVKAKGSLRLA